MEGELFVLFGKAAFKATFAKHHGHIERYMENEIHISE
jgi:hypothetical protein